MRPKNLTLILVLNIDTYQLGNYFVKGFNQLSPPGPTQLGSGSLMMLTFATEMFGLPSLMIGPSFLEQIGTFARRSRRICSRSGTRARARARVRAQARARLASRPASPSDVAMGPSGSREANHFRCAERHSTRSKTQASTRSLVGS